MTDRAVLPPLATAFGAVAVGGIGVFAIAPSLRDGLLVEDGPLETATALVFLMAAGLAMRTGLRSPNARPDAWIVAVFAALAFLDEISFGARIIGYPSPQIDGITIDSLHDVFDLVERLAERVGVGRAGLALGGVVVLVTTAAWLWRSGRGPGARAWLLAHRAIASCGVAIGLLLAAVALDLLGTSQTMRLAEELAELAGATATVGAALSLQTSRSASENTLVGAV